MHYATPKPSYFSGDWNEDAVYPGWAVFQWSGGVEWLATRETAERVVKDQERLFGPEGDPWYSPRLYWDGDDMIFVEDAASHSPAEDWIPDPDRESPFGGQMRKPKEGALERAVEAAKQNAARIKPDADGRYHIGFGWTWGECGPDGGPPACAEHDPGAPTEAQRKAVRRFNDEPFFTGRPLHSSSLVVLPDGTHEFRVSIWDGDVAKRDDRTFTSVHIATVSIARDGKITVTPAGKE